MPSSSPLTQAAAALLLCGSVLTAQAGSLGTSSAAGGSSASVGSSASSDASSSSSGGRQTAGQTITARARAYGTEFVHDASRQAFFLVLTDGFQRELDVQLVRL